MNGQANEQMSGRVNEQGIDQNEESFFDQDEKSTHENGRDAKEKESGNDEIDPLDEFMMEINKVLEEEKQNAKVYEEKKNNLVPNETKSVSSNYVDNGGDNCAGNRTETRRGNNSNRCRTYFVKQSKINHDTMKDEERTNDHTLDSDEKNGHTANYLAWGGGHTNQDDDSLDDNDVTADIYEFLEKKNEEMANEKRRAEAHGGKNATHARGTMDDHEKDSEDGDFFHNERNNNRENELIENDINYEEIQLDHFDKDIFVTDASITNFTLEESVEYKKKNNITTIGFNVPKPIFSFLQLKNVIDKDILENMYNVSISILSPIQSIVIPIFLSGRDFIANSRTGSGKTLSFILSLIIHLLNYKQIEKNKNKKVDKENILDEQQNLTPSHIVSSSLHKYNPSSHALILTPTRELCVQILENINKLSMNKLKSCILFSGINYKKAYDDIHRGVDIIIANVKTLINFVNKKYIFLTNIKYVILDEFDRLFSKQFVHSVTSILKNIRPDAIKGLFSSTFSEQSCELAKPYLNKKFIIIKVGENNVLIDKKFYIIEENYKYSYLLKCLHTCIPNGQGFIFCNSKKNVMILYEKLKKELSLRHISFDYIYGDIDQTERMYKFESLKKKKTHILISTDLMARGIDVVNLSFVINYDCPNDLFVYIHRIGRCSRINNRGHAITFIQTSEKRIAFLIYNYLKNKKEKIDEELENFILKNNLHNDFQMKKMKRKMNETIFNISAKKAKQPDDDNSSSQNDLAFKRMSAPSTNTEDALKNVKFISPNDILSSSDEEY
ncbi:ATP-dependent RNA helicase [Plasmodium gonderi]|uniref:ATP-dependent RNA helicase n=1 Tax=Plasmodium gonderi TaxID=77519 RepID=A0A1Y1JG26_PLAGO|nr:ATP-dependent RNA helicase [Plasmodium gonderi]GAW80608.1 ATP-dependent RNA helicase [Plasmodium gonderi]